MAIQAPLMGRIEKGRLEVGFRFAARDLVRGPENWQDGRLHLEWLDEAGCLLGRDFLGSCWAGLESGIPSMILTPPAGANQARLHVENLGLAGSCRVEAFHARSVQPRPMIRAALGGVTTGWMLWVVMAAGGWRRRHLAAAAIWVTLAWFMVLPGPWSFQLPLPGGFEGLGPAPSAQAMTPSSFGPAMSHPTEVETPNFLLRWKLRLQPLRPLLHGLLFFFPTLILLVLVPKWRAAMLIGVLALLIEAAQWAIGFGFEWTDVLDLATDALGIAAAVLVVQRLRRHPAWKKWLPTS